MTGILVVENRVWRTTGQTDLGSTMDFMTPAEDQ